MNYRPEFFTPRDFDHAKSLILTPEGGTTDARWHTETMWTLKMCDTFSNITESSTVLDWGCGVGRLSKAVIGAFGCKVVGVDLEPKMLEYAQEYVNDSRFSTIKLADAFNYLEPRSFSHVLAVWVFQHSIDLEKEIPLVYRSMQSGAWMLVVENISKAVPDSVAFFDDGIPTAQVLEETGFETQASGKIPAHCTTPRVHKNSWWKIYAKPDKRTKIEYNVHY